MRTTNKAKQRKNILTIWLVSVLSILSMNYLSSLDTQLDGTYLVITSDINSDDQNQDSNSVYRVRTDGTEVKRITRALELTAPYHTRISDLDCYAQSQQIAVATGSVDINGFHLLDINGENAHQLKPIRDIVNKVQDITFINDGEQAVISTQVDESSERTVLMRVDLAHQSFETIRDDEKYSYALPQWSHKNQRLAYRIESNDTDYRYHIAVSDLDASTERIIYSTSQKIEHLRWSPNGHWLAIQIGNQIYKIDVTDGTIQQLTFTPNGATTPQWSPDGTQISYLARSSFPNMNYLMVMDKDGGNVQKILTFKRNFVIQCWI